MFERDFADAIRSLRRSLGITIVVTTGLGLGIGAASVLVGVVDRTIVQGPPAVVNASRIHRVYMTAEGEAGGTATTASHPYVLFQILRDQSRSTAGVAGYALGQARVGRGPDSYTVPAGFVTAEFFSVLGVSPALGRFFTRDDDRPPVGRDVAVVSHRFWVQQLAHDPSSLRRVLRVMDREFTIVGVAPANFNGVERPPVDIWIPMSARNPRSRSDWTNSWNDSWMKVVVRLKHEPETADLTSEITGLLRGNYAGVNPAIRNASLTTHPLYYADNGSLPTELAVTRLLLGIAIVLIVSAAANASNVLLVRTIRRQPEFRMRVALGAELRDLVRLVALEVFILAMLAIGVGLALAYSLGAVFRITLFPELPWAGSPIDARSAGFAVLITLTAAVVVCLTPFAQIRRLTTGSVAPSSISTTGGTERWFVVLQILQAALSTILLVSAGMFVQSLRRANDVDLGVDPAGILAVDVGIERARPRTVEEAIAFRSAERQQFRDMIEQTRQLPSVKSVGLGIGTPFYSSLEVTVAVPGRDSLPRISGGGPFISVVSPGYFETVRTRILAGRGFAESDNETAALVVVINQTMARLLWPGEEPLGRCLLIGARPRGCSTVVGVAADAHRTQLREEASMQYYVAFGQEPPGASGPQLLVRSNHEKPAALVPALRRTLGRIVPNAQYLEFRAWDEVVEPQIRPWKSGTLLLGTFAIVALLVGAIGLYGVIAFVVAQKTREIGVRMALGLHTGGVLRFVLRRPLLYTAAGLGIGGIVGTAIATRMEALLFSTSGTDALVLAATSVTLLMAAILAALIPALRAARIQPHDALRTW